MMAQRKRKKRSDSGLGRRKKRRGERARLAQGSPHSLPRMPSTSSLATSRAKPIKPRGFADTLDSITASPPSPDDPMYVDYMRLMQKTEDPTLGWEVLSPSTHPWTTRWLAFRPSYAAKYEKYSIKKEILEKIEAGVVMIGHLHKFVISNLAKKQNIYTSPHDTVPVVVPFAYLEGTLIPMGEPGELCLTPKKYPQSYVGTVPIDWEGMHLPLPKNFKPIDEDPLLQGAECHLENSGMRYFMIGNQKYVRLGDYQTLDQIIKGLLTCGGNANCVVSFSYNCQHKCDLLSNAHEKRLKRITERDPNNHYIEARVAVVQELARFTVDVDLTRREIGPPKRVERDNWEDWNVANRSADSRRNPEMLKYYLEQRALALENDCPRNEEYAMRDIEDMNNALVMLTSPQARDERLFKQYLSLTQGRLSLKQLCAPLKRVSFFEYLSHFTKYLYRYSFQNIKGESVLLFALILMETYGGRLPHKAEKVLAIRYIGPKITAVSLNACGLYKNIGAGADIHVRNCASFITLVAFMCFTGKIRDPDKEIDEIAAMMPVYPGRHMK